MPNQSRWENRQIRSRAADPFILENTFLAKGGPACHFHYDQDEWFYALEGPFQFEVGAERFHLHPGDSLLVPRRVPHMWAFEGSARSRILVDLALLLFAPRSRVTLSDKLPNIWYTVR
jgi:mannose-6-phosphate isomerase-like protein (cupin superfamily)